MFELKREDRLLLTYMCMRMYMRVSYTFTLKKATNYESLFTLYIKGIILNMANLHFQENLMILGVVKDNIFT